MGLFVLWHTVQQGAEVAKQLAGKRGPELKLQEKHWKRKVHEGPDCPCLDCPCLVLIFQK